LRVALDTNVIAYLEGVNGSVRREQAVAIISNVEAANTLIVPVQALAELYQVLQHKAGLSRVEAARRVEIWSNGYETLDTSASCFSDAVSLSALHQLSIFDAIILAAAARGKCQFLLSEDMHSTFGWQDCTVLNPFAPAFAELLSKFPRQIPEH
jgi:predicted nucleic acid-binding protein